MIIQNSYIMVDAITQNYKSITSMPSPPKHNRNPLGADNEMLQRVLCNQFGIFNLRYSGSLRDLYQCRSADISS